MIAWRVPIVAAQSKSVAVRSLISPSATRPTPFAPSVLDYSRRTFFEAKHSLFCGAHFSCRTVCSSDVPLWSALTNAPNLLLLEEVTLHFSGKFNFNFLGHSTSTFPRRLAAHAYPACCGKFEISRTPRVQDNRTAWHTACPRAHVGECARAGRVKLVALMVEWALMGTSKFTTRGHELG